MKERWPVGLVVGGVALAVGLAAVALLSWQQREVRWSSQVAHLERAAEALAPLAAEVLSAPRDAAEREVDGWAAAGAMRVTLIGADGRVHADSNTPGGLVDQMESHRERPEVMAAAASGEGVSTRLSTTTNRRTTYVARRLGPANAPEGYLRVAWEEPGVQVPWTELLAALITALAAGLAARVGAIRWHRLVARHLAGWTDLPADEDLVSLAEDVDRRFRAEREALARETDATRAALAEVSEGVILLDTQGLVHFANPAARALLGADLAAGRPLVEAVRAPELLGAVAGVQAEGGSQHTAFAAPTGAELAVRVCAVPHPVLDVAVVLRDTRGERQLERARRALVADLAHELRTPLTVLGGLAEELRETGGPPAIAATMQRQVLRLRAFAEDLEELASIETGQVKLALDDADAATVARHVLADLGDAAAEAGVTLELRGRPAPLRTDPVRLAQVLTNLVDNAIRYNRPDGTVAVTTGAGGDAVRITVEDTGIGIPEAELPLVFQRFYRVRRGGQRRDGGTGSGLGLAIVKHLVRALGGTIRLTSEVGRGTQVVVSLPRTVSGA